MYPKNCSTEQRQQSIKESHTCILAQTGGLQSMARLGVSENQAASGAGRAMAGASGGLSSMLDLNGDRNPLDDILRMAGKVLR